MLDFPICSYPWSGNEWDVINASVSKLQRIFNIGFNRAGRIVDQMESAGFVSPKDSKNNRVIFCTQQEFEERFGEDL